MALAERFLRERYGKDAQHHHIFAIVSDGDLMEGIASEAASLAGHLRLSRLVYLYDDNDISLDGPTSLAFKEDTTKRFESYGWHVEEVADVEDLAALEQAIDRAVREDERPSLVRVRSIIGYPSPNKQGTSGAHGAPLGEDEVRLTKEAMGLDPDLRFDVPADVAEHMSQVARGAALQAEWESQMRAWRDRDPELAAEWDAAWAGRPLPGVGEALRSMSFSKDGLATRVAGKEAMAALAPFVPTLVGGAADLSGSTNTMMPGGESAHYTDRQAGRNVYFGVREHGMGGAVNGMAAHGGIVRPYGSTFLQFADYMRGSIRLSALMGLKVAWVFTHDSVGLGEDGPTHQPVEHLPRCARSRTSPSSAPRTPPRPPKPGASCSRTSTARASSRSRGRACRSFGRGDGGVAGATGLARGAYVLRDADDAAGDDRRDRHRGRRSRSPPPTCSPRRASPPASSRCRAGSCSTRRTSSTRRRRSPWSSSRSPSRPGVTMGWERWVDSAVGIDRFGASAPGPEVLERLGITPDAVAQRVRDLLG